MCRDLQLGTYETWVHLQTINNEATKIDAYLFKSVMSSILPPVRVWCGR